MKLIFRRPKPKELNLAWMIGLTIAVSAVLVFISFFVFLNSGAYATVKQISAAQQVLQSDLDDIDTTSPIQADDLEYYSRTLPQRVKSFNDAADFGPTGL
ncbi:MAG: hypothetical protein R3B12_05200 [Candidatus Saccharimonadales bacterium]|nr:hypothetical protein [Candidatus Nomurabacteria bacterium]